MSTVASDARWHRIFAVAAVVHAAIIFASLFALYEQEEWLWFPAVWVGLTTLWFFWPIILALHPGSSCRRAYVSLAVSALLLALPLRSYLDRFAPHVLGGDDGPVSFNPYDVGAYGVGYISGWVASKDRSGAETIALEGYGMGGGFTPGVPSLSAVAAKRYNVRVHPIASCGVNSYILGRAAGYNAVSAGILKERYGADIMDVLAREWTLEQERYEVAEEAGRAAAQREIAAGQLTLNVATEHVAAENAEIDMTVLAQNDIGLRQIVEGEDDVIGVDVLRYASAYNDIVEAEMERRFGPEVARAAFAAVMQRYLYVGDTP